MRSDLRAEDCDDANVSRLAELHGNQTIGLGVPEGACCGSDGGSIVLLNDASDDVLELFVELGEVFDARLNNLLRPLIDLLSLVFNLIGTDDIVYSFFGDALNILRIKFILVLKVGHFLFVFLNTEI